MFLDCKDIICSKREFDLRDHLKMSLLCSTCVYAVTGGSDICLKSYWACVCVLHSLFLLCDLRTRVFWDPAVHAVMGGLLNPRS